MRLPIVFSSDNLPSFSTRWADAEICLHFLKELPKRHVQNFLVQTPHLTSLKPKKLELYRSLALTFSCPTSRLGHPDPKDFFFTRHGGVLARLDSCNKILGM